MKVTYTKSELAKLYQVSYNTLISWLKGIPSLNLKRRRVLTPKEVNLIFDHLGKPNVIK